MRKTALRLLVGLIVAGIAAAIVYGSSSLIALAPPQKPISPSLTLTRTVSGYIAAICLGPLAVAGLGLLLGDTVRLLVPARHERFNLELARYRKSVGIDNVTEEGLRYVAAWRDHSRRTSLLLCLLIALGLVPLLGLRGQAGLNAVFGWCVLLVALVIWQRSFKCPRCDRPFHGRRYTRMAPPFCTHCGLPRDSTSTTAVAPSFPEWKKWNVSEPAGSATRRYRDRKRR